MRKTAHTLHLQETVRVGRKRNLLARLVCENCSRGRNAKHAREVRVRNLLARSKCDTCSRGPCAKLAREVKVRNLLARHHLTGLALGNGAMVSGRFPARRRCNVVDRPPRPCSGPGQGLSSPRSRASPYAPHLWHQVIAPDTKRRCSCPCAGSCCMPARCAVSIGALHAAMHAATQMLMRFASLISSLAAEGFATSEGH